MNKEEIEKKRAEQKKRRDSRCRHFTGTMEPECKAKVNYREHVGGPDFGWAARLPCIPDSPLNKGVMVKCEKYEPYSPTEIIAQELETMNRSKNMVLALGAIKKDGKERGEVPCPMCYAGKISYSVAKLNGHIWGKCSTEGCLAWMM